jgi:hypothetical protein
MADLATDHPHECLAVLRTWFENRPPAWDYARSLDQLRKTLRDSAAVDVNAYETAYAIVSLLLSFGTNLRDALPDKPPSSTHQYEAPRSPEGE